MRRGSDSCETSSWKFDWFAQVESEFVGEGPLRIVRRCGFDHVRLIVLVNREPGRAGKIPKIVHDDFLLSRVKQIETAHKQGVDGGFSRPRGGARRGSG